MPHLERLLWRALVTLLFAWVPLHAAHASLYDFRFTGGSGFGNIAFEGNKPEGAPLMPLPRTTGSAGQRAVMSSAGTALPEKSNWAGFDTFRSAASPSAPDRPVEGFGACGKAAECPVAEPDALDLRPTPSTLYRTQSLDLPEGTFADGSRPGALDASAEDALTAESRQWFPVNPLTVINSVPEPGAGWLLAMGVGLVLVITRRIGRLASNPN